MDVPALNPTINEHVVEDLYEEALLLADEARMVFDTRAECRYSDAPDATRLALSIEGMRTSTRLMHVLAWLLNQRAFLSGEISERQLRECGTLGAERSPDPAQLALLYPETRALIRESERLHARVARLDGDWRAMTPASVPAVKTLQGRIADAFGA